MIRTAIKYIRFEKTKSIGIVIGIVISVFLIGQQLATLGFLTSLMGGVIENANPDVAQVWVVGNQVTQANSLSTLNSSLVNEIKSIEGVKETYAASVGAAIVKFDNGQTAPVILVGSDAPYFAAGPNPEKIIDGSVEDLQADRNVSADFFDASTFDYPIKKGTRMEINNKEAVISVITRNARGFGGSYMFTGLANERLFTNQSPDAINAVLVQTKDDPQKIAQKINATFHGVKAFTSNDFRNKTVNVVIVSSNIGLSIGSLIVFAVISGFFIIGLLLYSSTFDRIKDYGTLKAIGANNRYLIKLIFLQSLLYAIVGFVIAIALLFGMKAGTEKAGLLLQITPMLLLELLLMTLFISVGGSFFAIQKIRKLEPASVFK
ncbi:MAG: FtsX-like permease family protein [Cyclobacteriaceae bacterium]|nr:FtsX-like permease family protein [Cyclobacteriaceae bacterium]